MSTLIAFTPQGRVPYWMMRHDRGESISETKPMPITPSWRKRRKGYYSNTYY